MINRKSKTYFVSIILLFIIKLRFSPYKSLNTNLHQQWKSPRSGSETFRREKSWTKLSHNLKAYNIEFPVEVKDHVTWLIETKIPTKVRRNIRLKYESAPTIKTIKKRFRDFRVQRKTLEQVSSSKYAPLTLERLSIVRANYVSPLSFWSSLWSYLLEVSWNNHFLLVFNFYYWCKFLPHFAWKFSVRIIVSINSPPKIFKSNYKNRESWNFVQ